VISSAAFNSAGHTILGMITTKAHPPWPGDSRIENYRDAGLKIPCILRLKLFTLDNRLLIRRLGHLSEPDANRIEQALRSSLL
jgi:mRNA interferase MazF